MWHVCVVMHPCIHSSIMWTSSDLAASIALGFGSLAARRVDWNPAPTERHSRGKTQRVPGKQTYTKKISTNRRYEGDKSCERMHSRRAQLHPSTWGFQMPSKPIFSHSTHSDVWPGTGKPCRVRLIAVPPRCGLCCDGEGGLFSEIQVSLWTQPSPRSSGLVSS